MPEKPSPPRDDEIDEDIPTHLWQRRAPVPLGGHGRPRVLKPCVFVDPPRDDEIDENIAAKPWVLRTRLTEAAYAARCALAGRTPDSGEWMAHLHLDEEEIQLIDDLVEDRRGSHYIDELGHCFRIRNYGNRARVAWFDENGLLQTMSHGQFRDAHVEKEIEIEVKGRPEPKKIKLVDHWLKHPLTKKYDRVDFQPGVKQEDMQLDVLNLWRGWPSRLGEPGWDAMRIGEHGLVPDRDGIFDGDEMPELYCDLFLDHMLNNMCGGDDEVMHYLLGWMADALWNPGPCDTAIILQGLQGSGKTFWAETFMSFFGEYGQTFVDDRQVLGNFNKHLEHLLVVFADDAFFAGSKSNAAKLKTFTTSKTIRIEPNGVDSYKVPKKFRLIMASNDPHIIRAEIDDRRNLVLAVDAGEQNQDKDYFRAMQKELDQGGLRALFRWLTGAWWGKAVGEGRFKMWKRPVTKALDEQKGMSLPPEQMIIQNMLMAGEPPCDFISDEEGMFVPTRLMIEGAKLTAKQEVAFTKALKATSGESAASGKQRRILVHGKSRVLRGRLMPSLAVARKNWETYIKRQVAWPSDVVAWVIDDSAQKDEGVPF